MRFLTVPWIFMLSLNSMHMTLSYAHHLLELLDFVTSTVIFFLPAQLQYKMSCMFRKRITCIPIKETVLQFYFAEFYDQKKEDKPNRHGNRFRHYIQLIFLIHDALQCRQHRDKSCIRISNS